MSRWQFVFALHTLPTTSLLCLPQVLGGFLPPCPPFTCVPVALLAVPRSPVNPFVSYLNLWTGQGNRSTGAKDLKGKQSTRKLVWSSAKRAREHTPDTEAVHNGFYSSSTALFAAAGLNVKQGKARRSWVERDLVLR